MFDLLENRPKEVNEMLINLKNFNRNELIDFLNNFIMNECNLINQALTQEQRLNAVNKLSDKEIKSIIIDFLQRC